MGLPSAQGGEYARGRAVPAVRDVRDVREVRDVRDVREVREVREVPDVRTCGRARRARRASRASCAAPSSARVERGAGERSQDLGPYSSILRSNTIDLSTRSSMHSRIDQKSGLGLPR